MKEQDKQKQEEPVKVVVKITVTDTDKDTVTYNLDQTPASAIANQSPLNSENLEVFATREEMGRAAGMAVEETIVRLLKLAKKESDVVRMIFAAAPSQAELLAYLIQSKKIDWSRVVAFHMDEYIGLPKNAPESFGNFLSTHLFNKVPFKEVHLMEMVQMQQMQQVQSEAQKGHGGDSNGGDSKSNGNGKSNNDSNSAIAREIDRYTRLLTAKPIDIVCLGIGENGHIAFNDPPVADFKDPEVMKMVTLDPACRQQQVNDGQFKTLAEVPVQALTLTIPTLLQATYLFCVVPGQTKQKAVYNTLMAPVSEACPATILRGHPHCRFYFDKQSYGLVEERRQVGR